MNSEELSADRSRSEQRFRTFFDSIDEGACIIEVLFDDADQPVDYVFLEINPVFEAQTGIANAVGRRMREIAPEHEPHWFSIYGRIALTGEPQRFQHRAEALGRWYDVYAFRIGEPGEHKVGILFDDMTDRRRIDNAAAQLAAIVTFSRDAVVSKDINGIITSWNRGAENLFGYTEAEVVGQSVTILIPPDHLDEEPEILAHIRRGQAVEHYETIRQRKDGSLVDISLTVSPIRNESGQIIGASKIARDVSHVKRLREATRRSELRFRRLFQAASDGILLLDAETGQVIDTNVLACSMLGLEESGVLGRQLHQIGVLDGELTNRIAIRELQNHRYLCYEHLVIHNARGDALDVEFVSSMYDEGDRKVAQCNLRDISERVRLTRHIAQQAQAIADESRRKDDFLAMLSHELRNPLAPIRSAIHLLRAHEDGSETPMQAKALRIIDRQVGNLTKLIGDLVEVSRVVSGRIQLNLEPVDLNQIMRDAVETVRPVLEQYRHEVQVGGCEAPAWVNGDAGRLEQVLVNLLDNAAKYTPEGGRIEVCCEADSDGERPRIRIRDNGVGINAELMPHIFALFTQADRSLARSQGGLGIGLSLARRLVELHGGTIAARSDGHGHGAEFVVTLARCDAPHTASDSEAVPPGAERDRASAAIG